jgi:hypothetical protein
MIKLYFYKDEFRSRAAISIFIRDSFNTDEFYVNERETLPGMYEIEFL